MGKVLRFANLHSLHMKGNDSRGYFFAPGELAKPARGAWGTGHVALSATMPSMGKFGRFLSAIWSDWLARMSGPLTVPFAVAALLLPSTAAKMLFAALAVIAALLTCYRVWVKEFDRAEVEKAKNEAVAPKMDISILCAIPRGKSGLGLTDLFFNVRLVLEQPIEVAIQNFTLTIFDEAQSVTLTAIHDVPHWVVVKKKRPSFRPTDFFHVPCDPLPNELKRRGDPVQGWIHFPCDSLVESFVQRRSLTLKVNCAHGTCYFNLDGSTIKPDPDVKGEVWKARIWEAATET